MLRALSVAILAFWSCFAFSASESAMSLLDNRFRVDPTIEQITFLVYREQSSQPVVLVRPDGKKYYAWGTYDNVRWYQAPSLDIISVAKPMAGCRKSHPEKQHSSDLALKAQHRCVPESPLPQRSTQVHRAFNLRR